SPGYGAPRLSPRQGGARQPTGQRTSIPSAQWRPQQILSGQGAWQRSLSAESRAALQGQGAAPSTSKVLRRSHREASPGDPGPCYSSRSLRNDDPLSRTFASGEVESAQVLCAPRETPSPRPQVRVALPPGGGAPGVQRCASASLVRPNKQSPQRQSSTGPFSARASASPQRKSPSPEPRCIAPESPRNNTRAEGRRPKEGDGGFLGLERASRSTEHLLMERIAALEAQVIDRHDLLQKISKQQEQLDRLENLARENAKLKKAQVAKGPARRGAPANTTGGQRRGAPRPEPTVTRRMAPVPQASEALLPTLMPRRGFGQAAVVEVQKARSPKAKPSSGMIPVRSNSQEALWQPLSSPREVLKVQASMSVGQLVPEKKAQELDLRLGELEAALGLPNDGSEATTTGPRLDELDVSPE
ncbi:warA, partial [Symbiodinium sp. CCMP2456]